MQLQLQGKYTHIQFEVSDFYLFIYFLQITVQPLASYE